jgi:GR25 family glycosyltransferase involved in LPS biosynthesis
MNYRTFVINMKRNPERLEFMTSQLHTADITFEIQHAVDGKLYDFSREYNERHAIACNGVPLSAAEKGCALSHRMIHEKMIRENMAYALILEDDVALPKNFKKIVEKAIQENNSKKTTWEYLTFNYPYVGIRHVRLWLFLCKNMFKNNISFVQILKLPMYVAKFLLISMYALFEGAREHLVKKYHPDGKPVYFYRPLYLAGCYVLTYSGAQKIMSLEDPLTYTADRVPNVARIKKELRWRAFCPMIVPQRRDLFKSTLSQQDLTEILDALV